MKTRIPLQIDVGQRAVDQTKDPLSSNCGCDKTKKGQQHTFKRPGIWLQQSATASGTGVFTYNNSDSVWTGS